MSDLYIFHQNISISSSEDTGRVSWLSARWWRHWLFKQQYSKHSKVSQTVWVENYVEAGPSDGSLSKTDCYCFIEKFHLWHWASRDESGDTNFLNNEYELTRSQQERNSDDVKRTDLLLLNSYEFSFPGCFLDCWVWLLNYYVKYHY